MVPPTLPVDACGNEYPIVVIGNQVWMAENMRCNKYDTKSSRAGTILPTEGSSMQDSYYNIPTIPSFGAYVNRLSDEQKEKVGYLYTWSAATAIVYNKDVPEKCQGICPNGWHVPTKDEWNVLKNYIINSDKRQSDSKSLKMVYGWCYDGSSTTSNDRCNTSGEDIYGFNVIPPCDGYFIFHLADKEKRSYEYYPYGVEMSSFSNSTTSPLTKSWGMGYVRCIKD